MKWKISLKYSNLLKILFFLSEGVSKTIENEAKEHRRVFLSMLLGTLSASLLRNILAGKKVNRAGEGIVRTGYGNKKGHEATIKKTRSWKKGFLMPPHPLTNFEIQKSNQNKPRFNGIYSRDNIPKIKDGANVINLDEYYGIGTHWTALYVQNNDVNYFDRFEVEHIIKKIKKNY